MGCRSSSPLDVVGDPNFPDRAIADDDDIFIQLGRNERAANANGAANTTTTTTTALDILTLADLANLDDRLALPRATTRTGRGRRNRGRNRNYTRQEERMADIAALQQSLSAMEDFFQQLVLGQTTGFYMEAMDPNNNAHQQHGSVGPPPASDAAIASLHKAPLTTKEHRFLPNKLCSVCCEAFEVYHIVSRLPCGHIYHPHCVEPWLHRHCTCPSCRYELPTDDEDFEEGRMQRMALRKPQLPLMHQDENADQNMNGTCTRTSGGLSPNNDDEKSRPGTLTWEESNSWEEQEHQSDDDGEGVHLLGGGGGGGWGWYGDFGEQQHNSTSTNVNGINNENSGGVSSNSWMIRLMDDQGAGDDDHNRPSTVATSQENDGDDEQRIDTPDGGPTPRASNTSERKTRHFGNATSSTDEMVVVYEHDAGLAVTSDHNEDDSEEVTAEAQVSSQRQPRGRDSRVVGAVEE